MTKPIDINTTPRLFISYSWSDPAHEQWVIDLAGDLRSSGIDVILDKWDLKAGHDAIAFMEKMVTDPKIHKVAIITDKSYAEKADGRAGGVGTETQIISKEVYDKQQQNKFAVVVSQKDENGKPYLPAYYKSRIYIDLSEPDSYGENFEKLLRWVFDKPLHVKPEIGKRPSFLEGGQTLDLGTNASSRRALNAIKSNNPMAPGFIDEYFDIFAKRLERFRLSPREEGGEHFDDYVVRSVEAFLPARNELIQMFIAINKFAASESNAFKVHRFFEKITRYMFKPEHISTYTQWDFDNYKFIVHELFLYAVSIFIKYENFYLANLLLSERYYLSDTVDYEDVMSSFTHLNMHVGSLEERSRRLKRRSLVSDLLKDRAVASGIAFSDLLQADFVLFIRSQLEGSTMPWFPDTLLYLGYFHRPFEIFARSISDKYFGKVKVLFEIEEPSELDSLLREFKLAKRRLPNWGSVTIQPEVLLGRNRLATRP